MAWQVDHWFPEAKGGGNEPYNLRAMQRSNNQSKSDNFPGYDTVVSSDGNKNVKKKESWKVGDGAIKEFKKFYPDNKYLKNL